MIRLFRVLALFANIASVIVTIFSLLRVLFPLSYITCILLSIVGLYPLSFHCRCSLLYAEKASTNHMAIVQFVTIVVVR